MRVILSISLFLMSFNLLASAQTEIEHLLSFVAATDCRYERNGSFHNGAEAVEHIQKKYDYYQDKIKTSEDFIRLAATKSMISGKHYLAHCDNQQALKSSTWLLTELSTYRSRQGIE